jgi:hypothetical protein
MIAQGWIDEGIAFCAYAADTQPVKSVTIATDDPGAVRPLADCKSESMAGHSCIGMTNVPVPTTNFAPASNSYLESSTDEFNSRTGIWNLGNPGVRYNLGIDPASRSAAAADVFVQLTEWKQIFGIHVATASRGTSLYSSVTALYKLDAAAPLDGQPDPRLFPFRLRYGTEYELALQFTVELRGLTAIPLNHAYGNGVIEFVDTRSGRRFRFNTLAYGTPAGGEFSARAAKDGAVIVGTSFREGSPFGRNVWSPMLNTPAVFANAPVRQSFQFRTNRAEFQEQLAAARRIDPQLSGNPDDYLVDLYGMNNEIFGDGEIGLSAWQIRIDLLPR